MRRTAVVLALLGIAGAPGSAAAQAPASGGEFQVTPTGYIQLDLRSYPDWPVAPGTGRLSHDTFEVRRLRAGVDGSWKRWTFEFSVDPMDEEGTIVRDAYVEARVGSYRLRAGQFKISGSREYATSARNLDVLERAGMASSLAAHRDVGVMVHGAPGARIDYDVGVFAGDGTGASERAGLTAAGRVEWEPSGDLIVAVSASEGRLSAVENEPENGLNGRMPSGYRFFEDVYVQGRRSRLGADVEWSPASWQFTVEAMRAREERREQGVDYDDLPSVVGVGVSTTARWRFARRRDLAARYEYLGFDDAGPETDRASVRPRAADVRARAGHAVTGGVSWGVTPWLRMIANAGIEWFSEPRSVPDPPKRGTYPVLAVRLQIELP